MPYYTVYLTRDRLVKETASVEVIAATVEEATKAAETYAERTDDSEIGWDVRNHNPRGTQFDARPFNEAPVVGHRHIWKIYGDDPTLEYCIWSDRRGSCCGVIRQPGIDS